MLMRVLLSWLYRLTVQVFFNVLFNGFHLGKIILSGKLLDARIAKSNALAQAFLGKPPKMKYQYDGITKGTRTLGKWPCWTALPLVFAGMGFRGNCMDGAAFMKRALGAKVRVWIPDGPKWWARVHYVAETHDGKVWALEGDGLKAYKSLDACRSGGRWI